MHKTLFCWMLILVLSVVNTISVSAQDTSTLTNTNLISNTNPTTDMVPIGEQDTSVVTDTSSIDNSETMTNGSTASNADSSQFSCPPAEAPLAKVTDAYTEVDIKQSAPSIARNNAQLAVLQKNHNLQLGDVLTVEIENLSTLLNQAQCDNKRIVLFLDELPLINMMPYPPTDPTVPVLHFTLKRTADSMEVWTHLLGSPSWDPRVTKVSVGIEDEFALPSSVTINLTVIPLGWFWFWVLLFVGMLGTFLWLAKNSYLLRDAAPPLHEGDEQNQADVWRPFSLARVQIAWWFFLVLAAYLFIGIITGDFSTSINGTVLGLIGISSFTAVGAAFIDTNHSSPEKIQSQQAQSTEIGLEVENLNNDIKRLKGEIVAIEAKLKKQPDDANLKQELNSKRKALGQLQANQSNKVSQFKKWSNQSENFLTDILSDVNGLSFHRFQIGAWTLVLGIIFVYSVYKDLAMPTFDESLLALLGISAGTYLGFKIGEDTPSAS